MDSQHELRGHDFLPPAEVLEQIPGACQTENIPAEDKTIWVHYFSAASDHYNAEIWHEPGGHEAPGRWMGFGYARFAAFPEGAEWGYVDLDELEQVRAEAPSGLPVIVERDLAWQPKPFRDIHLQAAAAADASRQAGHDPVPAHRDALTEVPGAAGGFHPAHPIPQPAEPTLDPATGRLDPPIRHTWTELSQPGQSGEQQAMGQKTQTGQRQIPAALTASTGATQETGIQHPSARHYPESSALALNRQWNQVARRALDHAAETEHEAGQ
jgi:hypothetical protein